MPTNPRDEPAANVVNLTDVDRTDVDLVGGKAAHLGELLRIDGVHVPPGFCVTTTAYRRMVERVPAIEARLDRLSRLAPEDHDTIRTLTGEIRDAIEQLEMPGEIVRAIAGALGTLSACGDNMPCAVRSSATAEDSPTASFAGQQDTYLNIIGVEAVLGHVTRCWASLFTERATTYRLRSGLDHRRIAMAVVVQQMVFADAAGIMFTADPVTSNRTIAIVEAGFGLGEALVSGLVDPDVYRVRSGQVVERTVGAKQIAIVASANGGTRPEQLDASRRLQPALTDAQVIRLVQIGRTIEARLGSPQDIEWCAVGDDFLIVQSRPITTLFPVPVVDDDDNHVYVSVGHQQMMTDPMKPLGLSLWKATSMGPRFEAAGRLFVDVSKGLASPSTRASILDALGTSDPLIRDALETVLDRGDFIRLLPDSEPGGAPTAPAAPPSLIDTDPAIVTGLIEQNRASVEALQRDIRNTSGTALLDQITTDIAELKRLLFDPRSHQVFTSAMDAAGWLDEHLRAWLGETTATDTLTQSAPNNVTSEMGLALLDVADVIRPHRDVIAFLEAVEGDDFLGELPALEGGRETRQAIESYLDLYGMRCVGEIDITRPRWSEHPSALVPLILGNVEHVGHGESARRFSQGAEAARQKEQEILQRLRALPDGAERADETKRMIDRLRTFIGYREYPKYGIVRRYAIYKRALMEEAGRLVRSGVLRTEEDIFFLTLPELRKVVASNWVDHDLIRRRAEEFRSYQALTPPRVLTSDGEAVTGSYRRSGMPADALVGLAVSAGTIEGRARIILDVADADLEPGDILVTAFTDPSWSPLFVAVSAVVTEVGGMMTHGAVIAREYGLPAVVGVEGATTLIGDGQLIRVDGTDGYVVILAESEPGG